MNYPATLITDFYKILHKDQYPKGTQRVYSTWTPRSNKYFPKAKAVVNYGVQYFVKEYLIDYFDKMFFNRTLKEVVDEYERVIKYTLGINNPDSSHIEALHNLGYLPIRLKALKEGSIVPFGTPMVTVENTVDEFFWLTNYLESLMSSELWLPMTSATIASHYYELGAKYADMTVGNRDHLPFQFHDFSFRGMEGLNAAALSGSGHLLPFVGTDSIPSIIFHEKYYGANIEKELVGTSIPATEHSVMCAGTDPEIRDEYETFKRLITEVYPNGFISIVSDTYDFWKVIEEVIPKLKNEILARDGKVVIRPDSGDPVEMIAGKEIEDLTNNKWVETLEDAKEVFYEDLMDIVREETPHGEHGDSDIEGVFKFKDKYYKLGLEIEWDRYDKQYYYIDNHYESSFEEYFPSIDELGLVEALWNIFGGMENDLGYKVLDSHIGTIYGDSITPERAEKILKRLEQKGFAASNVVFGIGSFTYQYNTRDTFNFAMKATYAKINGEHKILFKDPKTDKGKKSQRGKVVVYNTLEGIKWSDGWLNDDIDGNQLETVFVDGELIREEGLSEIRERLFTNLQK